MNTKSFSKIIAAAALLLCTKWVSAQTETDAIMMNKKQWCNGATFMSSRWDHYWEGTFKRNNQNIGTYSMQSVMFMSNYGITNNLNVLATVPYAWTHVTGGTLHGYKGLQDIMLSIKWRAHTWNTGKGKLAVFGVGSVSTPLSNYSIDMQPVAIGMGSTNLTGRLTADYQQGVFFATISGAYTWRSNVTLDKNAYYTTSQHNTNEVEMPDMTVINFSAGLRKKFLVAGITVDNMTTLGGFDIRKNDMPFVSNRMNSTAIGIHAKYTLPWFKHIELVGGGSYVVAGRNVGQSLNLHAGAYYVFTF